MNATVSIQFATRYRRGGFTLLELLLALSIFALSFGIVGAAFYTTTRAWSRGAQALDGLHAGDFVMDQLVCALRSAAWFRTTGNHYGFRLEDGAGTYPSDRISWVASGTALVPADSPYRRGLHRLDLSVEEPVSGDTALGVRVTPPFIEEDELEFEPDVWIVGSGVRGLDCRIWDGEVEDWVDEWIHTNRLPTRIEVALYFDPPDPGEDPIVIRRLVDIPVAGYATSAVSRTESRRR